MIAYDYLDEAGTLIHQVIRSRPKSFRQRRPGARPSEWIWNLRGVRRVLYRLPEVVGRPSETVYLVEGEKDVHAVEDAGGDDGVEKGFAA